MKPRALLFLLVSLAAGLALQRSFFVPRPASTPPPDTAPPLAATPASPSAAGNTLALPSAAATPAPAAPASPPAPPPPAALSGFFGETGPVALDDIPAGPFRDSLESLAPTARSAALARLAQTRVPRSQISTLRATAGGGLIHICPIGPHDHPVDHTAAAAALPAEADVSDPASPGAPAPEAAPVPITNPPQLSSRNGASRVLYLDFNGHTVEGTEWNAGGGSRPRYDALPYDTDGNRSTFSDAEQAVIREVWARVAEDFAPFDINVTTVEPSNFTSTTGRVLITLAVDANGNFVPGGSNAGGVAYLDVFGDSDYVSRFSPAWAIADNVGETNAANIAEVVSHEFGHNLGLSHDGTTAEEYYDGHGSGASSWAPIMGAGYGRSVTTFSKGEYFGANNTQDDLSIISGKVPYRADDVGDTDATAVVINGSGANAAGRIERTDDADRYRFTNGSGRILVSLRVFSAASGPRGNNLDLVAELFDATGTFVASYNSALSPDIDIDESYPAGTYYLRVRPSGLGSPTSSSPTGYTAYGSLGQYTLVNNTGALPPPAIFTQPQSAARPLGSGHTFTVVADSTATRYQWRFNGTAISGATSAFLTLSNLTFTQAGTYTCAVSNTSATAITQPAFLGVYRETPQEFTVNPDTNTTFPTLVAGTFDDIAWSRDGQSINFGDDPRVIPSGATLRINGVSPEDAGTYTLAATFFGQSIPVGPVTLVVRPRVILSVPSTITAYRGTAPVVPITSSHENLVFRYSGLPLGLGYVPSTGALTTSAPGPQPGSYPITLTGTDPFANKGSAPFTLIVESRTLTVSAPPTLSAYTLVAPPLVVSSDATNPTYRYTGLPTGLGYIPATGQIIVQGTPPAPGTYPVTLTVTDPFNNSGTTTFDLVIVAVPPDLLVAHAGLVARDTSLNQNLGGAFTFTPVLSRGLPTGAYTGVLNLGATRYALRGRIATGGPGADLTINLTATAKGRLSLTLAVTLPSESAASATGQLKPTTGSPVALSAWPTPYHAKAPATPFVGKHVFALFPPEDAAPAAPAGAGFGTLAVTSPGRASWTAKLADGTRLTGSSALGRDGQVPVFARILKPGGSLLGSLSLASSDRSIDGSLSWLRSPAPAKSYASTALYRDGFGPLSLAALGGPLAPPPAGTRVLGLPDSSPNLRLSFLSAGLSDDHLAKLALPPFTVTSTNAVVRPTSAVANPAALSLALKPSLATFSGSFLLKDPNPLKPGASVSRKVSFQGVLLDGRGVGFFLLPGLKSSSGVTPPTLSGSVLLEPLPAIE